MFDCDVVFGVLCEFGLLMCLYVIGLVNDCDVIEVYCDVKKIFDVLCIEFYCVWSEVSWCIVCLCDNFVCVDVEYDVLFDVVDLGFLLVFMFDLVDDIVVLFIVMGVWLCVVILCE